MLWVLPLLVTTVLAAEGGTDALAVNQLCPKVPPDGWTQDYGLGQNRKEGQALQIARDQARERLRNRICSGMEFDGARCSILQTHMLEFTWGWDEKKNLACAIFAFDNHFLGTYEADTSAFRADIDKLADRVAAGVGSVPLDIDKPTWPEGCVAGPGLSILSALRASLARHPTVRLVASDRYDPTAKTLKLRLTLAGPTVRVDGELIDKNGIGTPVGGFPFAADLLSVKAEEGRVCASERSLGLKDGEKVGDNGLRVEVSIPSEDGYACEGKPMAVTIRVNQPSRVQLYSVLPDQSASLVWPPPTPEGGGHIEGAAVLSGDDETLIPFRLPEGGDESLVAIAVREGQGFLASESWKGYCRSPRPMGANLYPPDAAVGRDTYRILRPGEGSCGQPVRSLPDVQAGLAQGVWFSH